VLTASSFFVLTLPFAGTYRNLQFPHFSLPLSFRARHGIYEKKCRSCRPQPAKYQILNTKYSPQACLPPLSPRIHPAFSPKWCCIISILFASCKMTICSLMFLPLSPLVAMYMTVYFMVIDTQDMCAARKHTFPVISRGL
jgi:hypothetical protein